MKSLIILGRQPALGLAELESLYGADKITPIGDEAAALDMAQTDIDFMRLGGMVKFCKILTILDTTKWDKIHAFLESTVPGHAASLPEGKLTLGLSCYGLNVSPGRIQATGLSLKKLIRADDRPVRLVPNKEMALNSAQVLHNNLTRKNGWELVFVRHGNQTVVAQSIAVQDIESYAARDQGRPFRDTKVGMLPPKLAQTIINLANPKVSNLVVDPFCGTGVVLQEAALMGFKVQGSDLEPRMVDYTEKNLAWLETLSKIEAHMYPTIIADATSYLWDGGIDSIASETYLGRPLSSLPDQKTLQKIVSDCNTINKKFLQNVARQTKPGFRMCIAVPAWKTKHGFKHLPMLDSLEELGYTRNSFVHARNRDLIYHRPDQTVARELVVLIRK